MRPFGTMLVAAGVVIVAVATTDAALTTGRCLASKRKVWGDLRKCEATERAKALQGKPSDAAKCRTKFQGKLAKISARATKAAVACRFGDIGDGTVIDFETGLQWEKKTGPVPISAILAFCIIGDVHCVDDRYDQYDDAERFAATLNGTSFDGTVLLDVFAAHSNWRMPTIEELRTILDLGAPGCGNGGACIDQIFGPTVPGPYWSKTVNVTNSEKAWALSFLDGTLSSVTRLNVYGLRLVRNGL